MARHIDRRSRTSRAGRLRRQGLRQVLPRPAGLVVKAQQQQRVAKTPLLAMRRCWTVTQAAWRPCSSWRCCAPPKVPAQVQIVRLCYDTILVIHVFCMSRCMNLQSVTLMQDCWLYSAGQPRVAEAYSSRLRRLSRSAVLAPASAPQPSAQSQSSWPCNALNQPDTARCSIGMVPAVPSTR